MASFQQALKQGRVAESLIATWLRVKRGGVVVPAYEIEKSCGKGPQVFTPDNEFVSPDLILIKDAKAIWIEAKHKSVFTWHRISSQWTTGIDLRHYFDYFHVWRATQWPVWILFFHRESQPDQRDLRQGSPESCPIGLFGGELGGLLQKENHRCAAIGSSRKEVGHGRSGMVYWAEKDLRLLATKEEVLSVARAAGDSSWIDAA